MELTRRKNQLIVSIILFGIWMALAVGSLVWLSPQTGILSLALFSFTALVALNNIFKVFGWVLVLLGLGAFAYAEFVFWGRSSATMVHVAIYFVGLVGTVLTGRLVLWNLGKLYDQTTHLQQMVDELTMHENTGLVRWQYALVNLRLEVLRSRRYDKPFCLFLMQIKNWDALVDEKGEAEADVLMRNLSAQLLDALRDVDIAAHYDEITLGAILPETPKAGCNIVVSRILSNVEKKLRISLHFGIAVFPQNGVTDNQIVAAAETALKYAITSNKSIAYYDDLEDAQIDASLAADPFITTPGVSQRDDDRRSQPPFYSE